MRLGTTAGVVIDNKVWFSNIKANGLFCIDTKTYMTNFVAHFPLEDKYKGMLHKRCFECDKKLFFLPARADYLHIFSIYDSEFKSIKFEREDQKEAIIDAVQIDNIVYVFLNSRKIKLLMIDMKSENIVEVKEFEDAVYNLFDEIVDISFFRCSLDGKKILFSLSASDILCIWDTETKSLSSNKIKIGNSFFYLPMSREEDIVTQLYGSEVFFLKSGNVYQIPVENGSELINVEHTGYSRIIEFNGKVLLLPSFSNGIWVLDDEKFKLIYRFENDCKNDYKFFDCVNVGEELWLLPMDVGEVFRLDSELKIKGKFLIESDEVYDKAFCECLFEENSIVREEGEAKLATFLNYLKM